LAPAKFDSYVNLGDDDVKFKRGGWRAVGDGNSRPQGTIMKMALFSDVDGPPRLGM